MRSILLAVITFFAHTLGAQGLSRTYAIVYTNGKDTSAIERLVIDNGRWTGDLATASGRLTWSFQETSVGMSGPLLLSVFQQKGDTLPSQRVLFTNAGDRVRADFQIPARRTQSFPSRAGAFPLVNRSLATMAFAVRRIPRGQSGSIPVFLTSGAATHDATVSWRGDTAVVLLGALESRILLDANGDLLLADVPAENLRATRIDVGDAARVSLSASSYAAPDGAPYEATDVKISAADGHVLAATLTRPSNAAARAPVVITISGSGPQDRDETLPAVSGFRPFRQIADSLGRRGVAVLRYDDRGVGQSTGRFDRATSADFANDVRTVVAWLRARSDVDPDRIFLLGHSEGGMIAPMVAAADTKIAGIVLLAGPAKTGREIIDFQQRFAIDHDTTLKDSAARDAASARARRQLEATARQLNATGGENNPWLKFFFSYDPLATARTVRTPSLVLQGETDRQITSDQAALLGDALRASGNTDVTVRVFPGLNHLFVVDPDGDPSKYARLSTGRVSSEVIGAIADWIVAKTRPKS